MCYVSLDVWEGRFLRLLGDPGAVRITETAVGVFLISIMAAMPVWNPYAQLKSCFYASVLDISLDHVAFKLTPRTLYCSPALISIASSVDQSFQPLALH